MVEEARLESVCTPQGYRGFESPSLRFLFSPPNYHPMLKILHLFDRYLNTTMNWTTTLMRHTSPAIHYVAAPIVFKSPYLRLDYIRYLYAPWQWPALLPRDEWRIGWPHRLKAKALMPLYRRWLRKTIDDIRPDIVHAHFGHVGVEFAPVVLEAGVPYVVSFYGFDMMRLPRLKPRYQKHYRALGRQADALVVLGPVSRQNMIRAYGFPPDKVHINAIGVEVDAIPFRVRRKPRGRLRLLQVATFTPKKGQWEAVQAICSIANDCPNVHLTLTGEMRDPYYGLKISKFIHTVQLREYVQILPFTPHERVYQTMLQYDAFIHPSRHTPEGDSEGGATFVILEAMATGMPILSTRHMAIPHRVPHGVAGLLAEEGNYHGLAQNIRTMYEMSEEDFARMSVAARAQVAKHYNAPLWGKRMYNLYLCLKNRPK